MIVKTFYHEMTIKAYNGKGKMEKKLFYPKIIVYPPGPKTRELVSHDYEVMSPCLHRTFPLAISSAEGMFIMDLDGNRFIDLTSGWLTIILGHKHPQIIQSIKNQMNKLISYPYNHFHNKESTQLAEELVKIVPGSFHKKVLLMASRDDAVEAALKMSEWNTRRHVYLTHIGSYHGESHAALSLTSDKAQRQLHIKTQTSVIHIPFPYCYRCPLDHTEEKCDDLSCLNFLEDSFETITPPQNIAAFILEPIQVYSGVIVPPKGYIEKLWRILKNNDIPLIVNEGFTAFGRTGSWLAINHWNIESDAVIFSESLASGFPLTALVAKEDLMDWYPGSHTPLLGGNPLAVSAALAIVRTLQKENLLSNANREGLYIKKRLGELREKNPCIGDVRGLGLLIGIEIIQNSQTKKPDQQRSKKIVEECWRKGFIVGLCGKSTLLLAPPLTVNRETLMMVIEFLEATFKKIIT